MHRPSLFRFAFVFGACAPLLACWSVLGGDLAPLDDAGTTVDGAPNDAAARPDTRGSLDATLDSDAQGALDAQGDLDARSAPDARDAQSALDASTDAPDASDASADAPLDAEQGSLTLVANTNGAVRLVRGNATTFGLTLVRDIFTGPVSVSVVGLPAGVTADPVQFASGETTTTLTLRANGAATLGVNAKIGLQAIAGSLASTMIFVPIIIQDPAGAPDLTFGSLGIATIPIQGAQSTGLGGNGIVVAPDGRVVFCGSMATVAGQSGGAYRLFAGALTLGGQLDSNFGNASAGIFILYELNPDTACGQIQNDPLGGFAIGGFGVGSYAHIPLVVKLDVRGHLDPLYGRGTGIVTIDPGAVDSKTGTMVVDSAGKVVIAGFAYPHAAMARLSPNGGADPTFDPPMPDGGIALNVYPDAGPGFSAVALEAAGIWAGAYGSDFRVYRVKSDGTIDGTFGTGGVATASASGSLSLGTVAIVAQPDGRVVLVGSTASTIEAVRFSAEGQPDSSFGTNGLASIAIPGSASITATNAVVADDGRIVIAATLSSATAAVRLTADGRLDPSFGNAGVASFSGAGAGAYGAVAIDPWGRIVLGVANGTTVDVARFWP